MFDEVYAATSRDLWNVLTEGELMTDRDTTVDRIEQTLRKVAFLDGLTDAEFDDLARRIGDAIVDVVDDLADRQRDRRLTGT